MSTSVVSISDERRDGHQSDFGKEVTFKGIEVEIFRTSEKSEDPNST